MNVLLESSENDLNQDKTNKEESKMTKARELLKLLEGNWEFDVKEFKSMHPNIDLDAADKASLDDGDTSFQDQMIHQGYMLKEKDGLLTIETPYVDAIFRLGSGKFLRLKT